MNKLFNYLDEEEQTPQEGIYTIGDSLLYQFYCGNWSATVKEMIENNYSSENLIDYIESIDDFSLDGWLSWFDRRFFVELGKSQVKIN